MATNPHSHSCTGKFGYPIIWLKGYAFLYSPGFTGGKKQPCKQHGRVLPVSAAWSLISNKVFEFVHLFDGPIPAQFSGIHEALNFRHRCGGTQNVEMPTQNYIVELGAMGKRTTPQLLSALAAAKVPKSCIRQWMLYSGCGCVLVSVESVARLRKFVTKAMLAKQFALQTGSQLPIGKLQWRSRSLVRWLVQ